jgi:hypothetical protein
MPEKLNETPANESPLLGERDRVRGPMKDDPSPGSPYDFSDLVGRLQWSGDPVVEQKKRRNEWS